MAGNAVRRRIRCIRRFFLRLFLRPLLRGFSCYAGKKPGCFLFFARLFRLLLFCVLGGLAGFAVRFFGRSVLFSFRRRCF